MIMNYADEYVEALVAKWYKLLPASTSYNFRSNVAIALENQYTYHSLSPHDDLERKLLSISFKILPIYYSLLEPLHQIINFTTFLSNNETLRTPDANYNLHLYDSTSGIKPFYIMADDISITYDSDIGDYYNIAYEYFLITLNNILEEMYYSACLSGNGFKLKNLKIDRNIQFVVQQMREQNRFPNFVIKNAIDNCKSWSVHSDNIGNWNYLSCKTKMIFPKVYAILGNTDNVYYCTHIPIKYFVKHDASNKIEVTTRTEKLVHIVQNHSLGVIVKNGIRN